MHTEKIAIIGAGQMGNGIAHVCALAGIDVYLNDISNTRIEAGIATISGNLNRQVASEKITSAACDAAVERIRPAVALTSIKDADFVIEAASEDEALKSGILREIAAIVKEDTVIATNTSSISITRLGTACGRPENFIGLHFMNPVPVMELVEIIRGIATSDDTYQQSQELVKRLGKTSALVEDFPAFVVNRILLPMINEASYALYEGVSNIENIDKAIRMGANHPMGPLQLADFIGLDTCLSIMQVLYEGLGDSKYRPCPLLIKYVEAGWLGRKSGRGFYDYSGSAPIPTR